MALVLAVAVQAPAVAHKDHQKSQREAATAARTGMDQGAMPPRAHDLPADTSATLPGDEAVEIGEHDERRALAEDKPFGARLLDWLGRWHTAAVHFPMGLILGALLAEIIGLRRDSQPGRQAARVMISIGAVGAVVAAVLGWINAGFYVSDADGVLTAHRWLGTALAVLAIALALSASRSTHELTGQRTAYWTLLVGTAAGIAVQGYLGGSLVHGGLDHLAF